MARPVASTARGLRDPRDSGFTLVELVVAMVIIAGVLMALIAVQISAATTIVEARKREQATAVANEAMEQMRAIPWAFLSKGMFNGFTVAAGGDPHVSGMTLELPSGDRTLIMAPLSNNQLTTSPRPPLFSNTGSNKTVVTDAAVTNTEYTVRAYVLQPPAGAINTVDLAVIVEWTDKDGETPLTIIESTAFRGTGCGDETTSPYLGACQAFFDASSTSGQVTTSIRATSFPDNVNPTTEVNLLYPTGDIFTSLTMRSASAAATIQSEQISLINAAAQFGGTVKDDNDPGTEPAEQGWTRGYVINRVTATDDLTQSNTPIHVGTTSLTQPSGAEDAWTISAGGTQIDFLSRSDFLRPASATASSTAMCKSGIPPGQPCGFVEISNLADRDTGAGYMWMRVNNNQYLRLARRLAESPSVHGANVDQAWVARYKSSPSSSALVGCTPSISGAGCIAAGATRTMASLSIGWPTNGWDGSNVAGDGIVIIEGQGASSSCVSVTETVLAQRGTSQKDTPATFSRCGQVRYWTSGGYVTQTFTEAAAGPFYTDPVTWTYSGYTITATASVGFSAGSTTVEGDDLDCVDEACSVSATSGAISIVATYVIQGPNHPSDSYAVISVTNVEGPSVNMSYREAPVA